MRFVRPRRIEGMDYADPVARAKAWLGDVALSPSERNQLLAILQRLDPGLGDAVAFAGGFDAFRHANGIAEVPVEWWDVEDERGAVRYQLWLCCADAGYLFDAGTTSDVALISNGCFWGEGYRGDAPGSLAAQLDRAQESVRAEHPASELARIAFIDRPRPAKPAPKQSAKPTGAKRAKPAAKRAKPSATRAKPAAERAKRAAKPLKPALKRAPAKAKRKR